MILINGEKKIEVSLQQVYDALIQEDVFDKETIIFCSMLPSIKQIEFSLKIYSDSLGEILIAFKTGENLKLKSRFVIASLFYMFLDDII